ncbi:NAD(+) diphosphatase [Konateibacter massiliensis]|uniref:NAD(+) diphosphatase n=1 Tax=Konateibacter massiliensis TaxID=2002841 RepID=UPI000C1605CE|nr:NAD(+) diphosphatase [Konateibacter massiliensis]
MIQDIAPHIFSNQYENKKPSKSDYLLIFKENSILIKKNEEGIELPKVSDFEEIHAGREENYIYLFSIDTDNYFYIQNIEIEENGPWQYENLHGIRMEKPMWKVYAAAVGGQLRQWYENHQYCGRCGGKMIRHKAERAMTCHSCKNIVYPNLSPSVIVAITNKDKILLTKYAHGIYKNYALVAGYTEIGETLEETVRREVMEEVGLKVKDITYYKTQPWPFSGSLLVGYFAEIDGEDTVTLQESELSEATWFKREDVPKTTSTISLTNEMIEVFRDRDKFVRMQCS